MFDCTQVLDDLAFEEESADFQNEEKIQVAQLEFNGQMHPIYTGENRIGRDSEKCSIFIPSKALSKEHAVIEVADSENHHLYDLGSTNKTRLGKLTLQPFVRYNIEDKAKIMFADVITTYHRKEEDVTVRTDNVSSYTRSFLTGSSAGSDDIYHAETQPDLETEKFTKGTTEQNIFDAPTQYDISTPEVSKPRQYLTPKIVMSDIPSAKIFTPGRSDQCGRQTIGIDQEKKLQESSIVEISHNNNSCDRSLLEGDDDMFPVSIAEAERFKNTNTDFISIIRPSKLQPSAENDVMNDSVSTHSTKILNCNISGIENEMINCNSSVDETDMDDIFSVSTQRAPASKNEHKKNDDLFEVPKRKVHCSDVSETCAVEVLKQSCSSDRVNAAVASGNMYDIKQIEKIKSSHLKDDEQISKTNITIKSKDLTTELPHLNADSGDETDPEDLFRTPTQLVSNNKEKVMYRNNGKIDGDDLFSAPTQKFHNEGTILSKENFHSTPLNKSSESFHQESSDDLVSGDVLNDTNTEDVICCGTQETKRKVPEIEVFETPEKELSTVESIDEVTLTNQRKVNETSKYGRTNKITCCVEDFFIAPTQGNFLGKRNGSQESENVSSVETSRNKTEEQSKVADHSLTDNKIEEDIFSETTQVFIRKDSILLTENKINYGPDRANSSVPPKKHDLSERIFCDNVNLDFSETLNKSGDDGEGIFSQPTQILNSDKNDTGSVSPANRITKNRTGETNINIKITEKIISPENASNSKEAQDSKIDLLNSSMQVGNEETMKVVAQETNPSSVTIDKDLFSVPTQRLDHGRTVETRFHNQISSAEKDICSAETQMCRFKTVNSLSDVDHEAVGLQGSKTLENTSNKSQCELFEETNPDDRIIKILPKNEQQNCENVIIEGDREINLIKQKSSNHITDQILNSGENEFITEHQQAEFQLPSSQDVNDALKKIETDVTDPVIVNISTLRPMDDISSPIIQRRTAKMSKKEMKLSVSTRMSSTLQNILPLGNVMAETITEELGVQRKSLRVRTSRVQKDQKNNSNKLPVVQYDVNTSVQGNITSSSLNTRKSTRDKKQTWRMKENSSETKLRCPNDSFVNKAHVSVSDGRRKEKLSPFSNFNSKKLRKKDSEIGAEFPEGSAQKNQYDTNGDNRLTQNISQTDTGHNRRHSRRNTGVRVHEKGTSEVDREKVVHHLNVSSDSNKGKVNIDVQREEEKQKLKSRSVNESGNLVEMPIHLKSNKKNKQSKRGEISKHICETSHEFSVSDINVGFEKVHASDAVNVKNDQETRKRRRLRYISDVKKEECENILSRNTTENISKNSQRRKINIEQDVVTKTDFNEDNNLRRKRKAATDVKSASDAHLSNESLSLKDQNITPNESVVKTPVKITKSSSRKRKSDSEIVHNTTKVVKNMDTSEYTLEESQNLSRNSARISTRVPRTPYHVLFTGLSDLKLETSVSKLGGKVMDKPEECTVLVTDKVRRTYKFLCALGQGKPIVSPEWLLRSHQFGSFLDPWEFLLTDKENEKKFKFSLKTSLKECSRRKLLTDFTVAVTPNIKPPPEEMKGIVKSCGGRVVETNRKLPENSFIISCQEDKHMWPRLKKLGAPILGPEVLLQGVLQQKLDLNSHVLF